MSRLRNGHKHISIATCLLLAVVGLLQLQPSIVGAAAEPTLTLQPTQVSCSTEVTARGENFSPGSTVEIVPGGDIPEHPYGAALAGVTVAGDGTFSATFRPGIVIDECSGGPLGRGDGTYAVTAATFLGVEPPYGQPAATAVFSFAPSPDDPTLTLSPDHGWGCMDVVANGTNFEPGTTVTIVSSPGPTPMPLGETTVESDGTFTFSLPKDVTPFITCDSESIAHPGQEHVILAVTGAGYRDDDPFRFPSDAATFTISLTPAEHFDRTWARTDEPVAANEVDRTWVWGPQPASEVIEEPYAESPDNLRLVQYFDKSRMEINDPDNDQAAHWYVTNGLLVVEMVDGRVQVGDAAFDAADAADIPIAGDPASASITYADIAEFGLRDSVALAEETLVTEFIGADGQVVNHKELGDYAVSAAFYVPETDHTVASVFWGFMTSEGVVWENGQYVTDDLFQNPFYATGYPITEAYFSTVTLQGAEQTVLWQCFERRCLTYTPDNPDGWQVEAGNVGLHYHRWRYGD